MNKITQTQRDMALACMERLDLYKPYIKKFRSKQPLPCFFERLAGFWADQEEKLWNKIKSIEAEYGCLVYAITHEFSEIGETWSMLCISQNPDQIEDYISETDIPRQFYAYAYVWNASYPELSEFGDIVVRSAWGGIKRVY